MRRVPSDTATKKTSQVFFKLLDSLYDLWQMRVLSPFSGDGSLTVEEYLKFVDLARLECWTYTKAQRESVRAMGVAQVGQGDAYDLLKRAKLKGCKYDLIDLDTPQGIHLDLNSRPCVEHFRFFTDCLPLLGNHGII